MVSKSSKTPSKKGSSASKPTSKRGGSPTGRRNKSAVQDAGGGGKRGGGGRGGSGGRGNEPPPQPIEDASLAAETQRRYLNYALSVITARALPDVRDGLKPVQRRILYTMQNELHLTPDAKPRKSAAIVGDVLGKYHPHGDTAVYDAMVRLAQDFSLRAPLVEGQGNFGSQDGDSAAAMRYTEARLQPIAIELLRELGQKTVDWRPNYDGTRSEPIVLPARFPHLLVNGAQGIAVGMATSIPPHNLGEVIDACLALIDARPRGGFVRGECPLNTFRLLTHIKGPDFPTAGQLLASKQDLQTVYESGHGSVKLRGEWTTEAVRGDGKKGSGTTNIIISSIPYGLERATVVEKIAEVILGRKLPALIDVRDESTETVRVVLELKRGTDPQLVMAYLFRHTPLSVSVQVNLTCLVPTPTVGVSKPLRLPLGEILTEFLTFRFETLTKRLSFELGQLEKRIHLLEGFEIVFDALDEIIRIIRKSEGKADAAQKLIARFKLSEEQTDAILELKLYRLAKLEILVVRKELAEKRAEAKRLGALLKSDSKRWTMIQTELGELKKRFADKRRTVVVGEVDEPEFQAEDFIVEEDANVILSTQGWVKRVREVRDLSTTRLRDGDSVLAAALGSTRASIAFLSNRGVCYVTRLADIPATTGYGDPVQKLFKLSDGERMIAMFSFDPRVLDVPEVDESSSEPEPPYAVAITRGGLGFRFSVRPHRDPSTRAGRKYARLNQNDEIMYVAMAVDGGSVMCAASDGHALAVDIDDLALLGGVGKGSMVIKLVGDARLVGATQAWGARDTMVVETEKGKRHSLTLQRIAGNRAGRGDIIVKRDRFIRVIPDPVPNPNLDKEG